MTAFCAPALQEGLYTVLTGDSELMGLVSQVYDRPSHAAIFPYITIGECESKDWSTKTTTGTKQTVSLYVWSREGGRKETSGIMARLYMLLHNGALTVTEHTLVMMRFATSDITLERDNLTYRGTMQFDIFLEAN